MRTITKTRVPFGIAIVLAIVLVSVIGLSAFGGVSYAADQSTPVKNGDSLTVGHMSDIHYFPLEYCYQGVYNDDYATSDFYHSMTGDTKLVLESGIVFNAAITNILKDADNHIAPQYLLASGDLSKNGERVALIDVANTLRYLQNEMRKKDGYENFQVLATVGNHDLYNHNGALYSAENGKSRTADVVTAMQFAMIFAGLGFPNATLDGANGTLNLTDYLPAEYWSSSYTSGYQTSENASNLKLTYYSEELQAVNTQSLTPAEKLDYYFEIGDEIGKLTYIAEVEDTDYTFAIIDSADREKVDFTKETGPLSRISKAEYDSLKVKPRLYIENNEGVINTNRAVSSTVAFSGDKNVYRASSVQHITGGRITSECLDWIEAKTAPTQSNAQFGEKTIVSSFHHNVLPHFEQEDDILKDFTLYNWEYTAKRLLDMGIRYAFTGHMHASDAMTYTDVEGRTLYDFETGSMISYASPRRYITLSRFDCDGKLGEKLESSVYVLKNIKEFASDNIANAEPWNQAAYDTAIAAFNAIPDDAAHKTQRDAAWQAVLDSNEDYSVYIIRYNEFAELGDDNLYNDFISKDIYTIIVDRMIDHFITDRTINSLKDSVKTMLLGLDSNTAFQGVLGMVGTDGTTLNGVVQYIIDTVLYDLYPDTDADGKANYPTVNNDKNETALEFVLDVLYDVLNLKYGSDDIASTVNPANNGKMTVREIASFIMMSHSAGMEISLDETFPSIDAKFGEIACGENHFRFKQPTDKTYRKRMLAAIQDLDTQLKNGTFVEVLLDKVLDPLYNNNDSLLKTALRYEFDFEKSVAKGYLTQTQFEIFKAAIKTQLNTDLAKNAIAGLVSGLTGNAVSIDLSKVSLVFDANKLALGELINKLIPVVKPLVASLMGFNMEGNTLIEIVDNLLEGYVTPSFLVGLGGIADNIVMAFATDICPDLADDTNPALPFTLQPYDGYTYGGMKMSYVSTLNKVSAVGADFNDATQLNGRVPSRVTANFDTKDSTTSYTFKFYTAEDVYGTFKYKTDADSNEWITLSTSKAQADMNKDYIDATATRTDGNIKVEMLTQTKPVYLPLIDLGLACLTHAEIMDDDDVPYTYKDRDNAPKNSVVYWNVTTVTISGLAANTTYYYDLEGSYKENGNNASFSLAQFKDKQHFTFKTAADDSVTSFEFLTIADIQGMIQGMYDDSYAAVKALLADERTKDFDFILNAGDMCDNGKNFNQWAYALDTYSELFGNNAMFFAAGNHEDGSNAMANFFNYTLPTDEDGERLQEDVTDGMFFSFNYANAHFVVLNTNDANNNGLGEVQLEWLKKDLANSNAKWKFVLMHKSIFSGGSHSTDGEVVAMRKQLVPLFDQYGVNIVFAGHDHTYTSTYLIDKKGKVVDKSNFDGVQYTGDGVLYITLGTMGTKYYTYKENPNVTPKFDKDNSIMHTLDSQTFGKVVVDGDTLTFTGYYYNQEENKLETVSERVLSATKVVDKDLVISLSVVIPVVVIAAIVATVIILKKKGKGAKSAAADEQ